MSEKPKNAYLQCTKCGSTHFADAEYRQYLAGRYSTAPGGELTTATEVVRVRLCLCGHPAFGCSIKGLSPKEQQDFRLSLENATRYRQETEPERLKSRLRESFVDHDEYEGLAKRVKDLTKVVKAYATPSQQECSTKHPLTSTE